MTFHGPHFLYQLFVFIYVDYLIASRSMEDHRRHVREVLERLQENGPCLNVDKCVGGQTTTSILGHMVTAAGILLLHCSSLLLQSSSAAWFSGAGDGGAVTSLPYLVQFSF
jgi:hypothetical protein